MHIASEPAILYFGTPVVLVSTVNEDGSYNLAPMSSAFWLGWRCILGWGSASQTPHNMLRTKECVLNLPSVDMVGAVNRLALTTGSNPVPKNKSVRGYRYEPDKFGISGLTAMASETVASPRVEECHVQMEAVVEGVHSMYGDDSGARRPHARLRAAHPARAHRGIDPDGWPSQSRRSRQVAAVDHELSEILRPRAR